MIGAIIGVAVVCFLLLFLHTILDSDKHFIFQLLLIVFVLVGAFLVIPKMIIDDYTVCENLVANTTTVASTTTYEYALVCNPHPAGTDVTFYKIATTMFWLTIGYLIVFLAFWSFFKLQEVIGGGRRG